MKTEKMKKVIRTVTAVSTALVMAAVSLCMSISINDNYTDNTESVQYSDNNGAVLSVEGADKAAVVKPEDIGLTAADYTADDKVAQTVNAIANADADSMQNNPVELIPMENLKLSADNSSEAEVMGGRKEYIDNGGYQKSAVTFKETPMYVYGIDVSKWQGDINWSAVRASGVAFAMIKCAGRSTGDGSLYVDPYFTKNIQEAQAAGIQVGVYFFSQATNIVEAYEEACLTVMLCQQYNITYPVAFDWESEGDYRVAYYPQNKLTMNMIAATYCNTVASYGYTPMVYACKNDFNNTYDSAALGASYKLWLANYYNDYYYTSRIYMFERSMPATSFQYQMWQFGISNVIAGINGYVDMNIGFFYYMPLMTSNFQLTLASKTISATYGNRINLLDGVTAISSAGIDARAFVVYSIVDAAGQLVTEDYAFGNVGIYAVTYSLTDADGTTASETALLYVYPPSGV